MKNKRKTLEREAKNIRILLRENILTSSPLTIISNKNKNTAQYKTNPNEPKTSSTFSTPNNSKKKLFSFSMVKYKPQRLIHFKGVNIPLPNLGKASLEYSKTFNSGQTISKNKEKTLIVFEPNKNLTKTSQQLDFEKIIKNEDIIGFKNKYILKFAEFSDSFSKLFPLSNIMDETHKFEFKELFNKISKSLELQSQVLLNDLDEDFQNNNNKFINPYLTTTTSRQIIFGKHENKINDKIKKVIFLVSDYNNYLIKFLQLLSNEIKESKSNYMKLLKINYDYELKINTQMKQIDDIKQYLDKYNISKKIKGEKSKENTIKNIKAKFLQKENEYLMHNFQLKDEIFSLVKLLDKNKSYFDKYIQAKKEINDNKKNNDILRLELNKELQDKNLEYALEKDQKEELIIKLDELNESIKELKEERDYNKRIEIENNAQILKMKIVLNEKNEHLMMMNEELEHYIREYEKEKNNHQNSLNSLRALENRIYNKDKQQDKEKN